MEIETIGKFLIDEKSIRMDGFAFQLDEEDSDLEKEFLELKARLIVFTWVSQLIQREIADLQIDLIRLRSKGLQ